jgi:hypothetical protein
MPFQNLVRLSQIKKYSLPDYDSNYSNGQLSSFWRTLLKSPIIAGFHLPWDMCQTQHNLRDISLLNFSPSSVQFTLN